MLMLCRFWFVALILFVCALARTAAADAPASDSSVDARFGNVLFKTPDPQKWERTVRDGRLRFVADTQGAGFCSITVFPGKDFNGDFVKDFNSDVVNRLKEAGMRIERDGGNKLSKAPDGYEVLERVVVAKGKQGQSVHWFVALHPKGRLEIITFDTETPALFEKWKQEAAQFMGSVKPLSGLSSAQVARLPQQLREGAFPSPISPVHVPEHQPALSSTSNAPAVPHPPEPAPAPTTSRAQSPPLTTSPPAPTTPSPAPTPPSPLKEQMPDSIRGKVVGEDGKPITIKDAKLTLTASGKSDQKTEYSPKLGADGSFEQKLGLAGSTLSATLQLPFNGKQYVFDLEPREPAAGAQAGAVGTQDYVWKTHGLRAGQDPDESNFTHWYGCSVNAVFQAYRQDIKKAVPKGGAGVKCVFTLTPKGKLVDGSEGKPLTFTREYDSLVSGLSNSTLPDIPLGVYTMSGQEIAADGSKKPLLMQQSFEKFGPSVEVQFEPSSSTGTWPVNVGFTRQAD